MELRIVEFEERTKNAELINKRSRDALLIADYPNTFGLLIFCFSNTFVSLNVLNQNFGCFASRDEAIIFNDWITF